jgi:CubicO group peptidase (beta-lactamase class C family)
MTTSSLTSAPASHSRPSTAQPEHAHAAVDALLLDQLETLGIPGAAIAVVRDGTQVHSAAFGKADPARRPLTPQTPVLLASTSKSLTAIAVMQQVEAGRLQLDEPVRIYLPWFTLDNPPVICHHSPAPASPNQRHVLKGHSLRSVPRSGAGSPRRICP